MNNSAHQKLNLFEPDSIELESKHFNSRTSPRENLGMTRNPSDMQDPNRGISFNQEDRPSVNGWNGNNEMLLKYDGLDESSDAHNMILCHALAKADMGTFKTYIDKMRYIGSSDPVAERAVKLF